MSKGTPLLIGLVLVVLVFGGWFYLQSQNSQTQPITTPSSQSTQTPALEATDGGQGEVLREISVEGSEYKFSPDKLSVRLGEKVKLTFTNTGKLPHNLVIDDLGVATKTVGVGQSDTIEFTVSKSGDFKMYCSVGNHEAMGMKGQVQAD